MNKYIFLLLLAITAVGCEDFIGGDINANPNSPTSVPINAQMPAIEIALADVYGGAFSRFNCMLTQQVEGVARQWSSFNQYTGLTPNRYDAAWQTIYEDVLNEVKIARLYATNNGLNHYNGILDIIEGFALMTATDVWDDIPYSEALQGVGNLNPKFDSQASIYSEVITFLDRGMASLGGAVGSASPGDDEVFYNGDAEKWIKAARAMKARAMLHQGNYSDAMQLAQNSFADASDNFAYQYPDANAAGNWYRFNRDRTGDLEFSPTMRGIMTNLDDTLRLAAYDQIFNTDHTYLVPNFNQELVTYREMQFLIAECAMRGGNSSAAHAAYLEGIKASFVRAGASSDDYLAQASVDPGEAGLTMDMIMTQKYLGLFLQPEVYNDYRRTNIPSLTPVSGSNVPVRWDYCSTEYTFNSSAPTEGTINVFTDRVGWNR